MSTIVIIVFAALVARYFWRIFRINGSGLPKPDAKPPDLAEFSRPPRDPARPDDHRRPEW
jgi:hypothetical protein